MAVKRQHIRLWEMVVVVVMIVDGVREMGSG